MSLNIALLASYNINTDNYGIGRYLSSLKKFLELEGVKVHLIETEPGIIRTSTAILYNIKLLFRINKSYNTIDLINGNLYDGFILSFFKKVPYIITLHGIISDELNIIRKELNLIDRFIYYILGKFEYINAMNADKIITVSNYSKQCIKSHYGIQDNSISVIYPGIDFEYWNNVIETRVELNGLNILFVGSVNPRKGLEYLLNAMHELVKYHQNLNLIVVGGYEVKYFQKLNGLCKTMNIENNVKFLGKISNSELVSYYKNCDIFCLPSLQEGFGFVNIEAQFFGLPIISTDTGSIPETIIDGKTGILVPPKDSDAIFKNILYLLNNESMRLELGRNAKKFVIERFDGRKNIKNIINIYYDLINTK